MSKNTTTRQQRCATDRKGRTITVAKFHSEEGARDWAYMMSKGSSLKHVVMGDIDDKWGRFWVCDGKGATRLCNGGYEGI